MPTLTIEGRDIDVDDGFLSMSPQDQERTVQDIADQLKIQPQQASPAVEETDGPQTYNGVGMNSTAGLNDVLYGIAGAPVDLTRGAVNLGIRGINAVTGSQLEQLPPDYGMGSQKIGQMMGEIHPAMNPQNTIAETPEERVARSTGQGVAATVLPAGAVGAMSRAGALGPQAAQMATKVFGGSASVGEVGTLAAVGGAGGAGAGTAVESVPEEYKGLAALLGGLTGGGIGALAAATPSALRAGTQQLARYAEPLYTSGQRQAAGRQLNEAATAPQAAIEALEAGQRELVLGSLPTTGQMTGDMGLLAAERGAATRSPDAFMQRATDQNAARLAALEPVGGAGAPEKVSQSLRQRLEQIDEDTHAALTRATTAARNSANEVGMPMRPEDAGASLRSSLEAARTAAKSQEDQLWQAVDPDGTLALKANSVREQAASITKTLPKSAKPPAGEEAAILDIATAYGDVVPFSEIAALQSRVKAAMREERMTNGESPAYRRMSQMSGALYRDLETAVAGKVEAQAKAVAAGILSPEQTIAATIQRETERWLAQRESQSLSANGGGGPIGSAGGRQTAVSRTTRAEGATGSRSDFAEGYPGVSRGTEPNFDQGALDRLNTATEATRTRFETFDNKTLGPIRRRPGTMAPYDMPAASVPQRIFFPQPKSGEAIRRLRDAVGDDQAMMSIEGYAVDTLRRAALREDGTLDPAKLGRWRDQHRDALEAFPALQRRMANAESASEAMATVEANRRQYLDAAQRGTLGRIMGVEDPSDVTRIVGSVFSRQDAVQQMTNLRQAVGNDQEGIAGLKKATAEFMTSRLVGNTEAGTSGQARIKSDQMQTFVRQNKTALRTIFSEDEVATMEAVAADLQRSARSQNAVRLPGGSNTAQDTLAAQDNSLMGAIARVIGTTAAAGGGASLATNSVSGAGLAAATLVTAALRERGVRTIDQLVRDALLNPDLAKTLMQSAKTTTGKEASTAILKAYRANALTSSGAAIDEAAGEDDPQPLRILVRPEKQEPGPGTGDQSFNSYPPAGPASVDQQMAALLSRKAGVPKPSGSLMASIAENLVRPGRHV